METESKQELMKLAALHFKTGRYEMAIETCNRALTIDPIYLRGKHGLARSLASLHRCKEALEEFNWVLEHDGLPNALYSELYKQRGDVYFEMQDFLNALDDYDRALRFNRNNEEVARMRMVADKYHLQQRTKLGKNDILFGYPPYFREADVYASNGYKLDENDEQDDDYDDEYGELRYVDIADDDIKEWKEEYEADYIEYFQDWEIYTETYN